MLSRIGGTLFLGLTGFIRLFGNPQDSKPGAKPTSTWKPTKTTSPTITRQPQATHELATATLTRRPRAQATATSTPTATVNRTELPSATPKPTYTRRPLASNTPTHTAMPTSDRSTSTPTVTITPTATPDLRGLLLTTPDNFERVLSLVAIAVNAVSVVQEGGRGIDKSDLVEDFLNFNRDKRDAYLRGERPYRYLRFNEYRHSTDTNSPTLIRAVINVPDTLEGTEERKYLDAILDYLNKQLKVDVSKLDQEHRYLITRDIMESNRFTCIKFLRFLWGLFGDVNHDGVGMFPQVYQARIINAGQLARQIESGKSLFDPTNFNILQTSLIKNADAIAAHPEDNPDFFDNRVVVFFRPQAFEAESGHVGVAKIFVIRDAKRIVKKIVATFIEADGNTGQAYYGYRIDLDEFRNHLFMDIEGYGTSQRVIGWMFNRTNQ